MFQTLARLICAGAVAREVQMGVVRPSQSAEARPSKTDHAAALSVSTFREVISRVHSRIALIETPCGVTSVAGTVPWTVCGRTSETRVSTRGVKLWLA